eukprot:CAMPEP_0197181540 /NCGR_PEP_ID=MMETSP1423-20130617/5797_1 /TAXON_ID=476441 /ORGANISM="Pseudo-nitzschia heimii, Strain UNC1101" /LENGTH=458 /DNA_ID=CAMNT_0042631811 /DNA_START=223 /DNA_END=1599 /DNA_ORIENTATION=-
MRGILAFVVFLVLVEVYTMLRRSVFTDEAYIWDGAPIPTKQKVTVAYAVSITQFKLSEKSEFRHMDRAAVLHQSIKSAMQKSERYDYHIYAFVHPDAKDAEHLLKRLGYRVQIRDTPFNISDVDNPHFIDGQRIGCCGEKEYLKLYSYTLTDYPVVVHLDLDTLVLRPMDDLFDFMYLTHNKTREITQDQVESFSTTSTMWMNKTFNVSSSHAYKEILENPEQIDFMFTRDYNMVDPPRKQPYQIGVQGGFLVIRPNRRDFDRMVEIIRNGRDFEDSNWGGPELGYGDYYGVATIQGLASYYYDHHENATRSVELNRCKYNTMVDEPLAINEETNEPSCISREEKCEDCTKTELEEIYTAHFTICGKPEYCLSISPKTSNLCFKLMREWHLTRLSLELDWMNRFWLERDVESRIMPYVPTFSDEAPTNFRDSTKLGHCKGREYIPLALPGDEHGILIS